MLYDTLLETLKAGGVENPWKSPQSSSIIDLWAGGAGFSFALKNWPTSPTGLMIEAGWYWMPFEGVGTVNALSKFWSKVFQSRALVLGWNFAALTWNVQNMKI